MSSEVSARKVKLTTPRRRTASDHNNDSTNGIHTHSTSSDSDALKTPHPEKLTPLIRSTEETDSDKDRDIKTAPSKEEKAAASKITATCLPEERRKKVEKQFHDIQRSVPCARKMTELINMCPPRVRVILLSLWVLWKVILLVMFLHVVLFTTTSLTESSTSENASSSSSSSEGAAGAGIRFAREAGGGDYSDNINGDTTTPRVFYIVTTLAEYNNGLRKTEKGQDRLGEVLIPILVDSVESMVHEPFNFHVDVYLISAFTLKPEREQYIRERLPDGVGFEFWDDACPLGYEVKHSDDKVIDNTRALSRQHRYVIKDKLPYYDLFVAFEDDMRVTGDHVLHFLKMSDEIERLRLEAPERVPGKIPVNLDPKEMKYYGPLTRGQLDRIVPGFIRVEVLLDEKENGAQTKLDNIDRDFMFEVEENGQVTQKEVHFNPRICCHVQMKPNKNTPVHPSTPDVIIWETNVKALSALNMPKPKVCKPSPMVDWVGVLPGPGKRLKDELKIGGYWSGREGAFGSEEKPSGGRPDIIAQQGGWMATRSQIKRMNDELCMGAFLPPFDEPMYRKDGQESFNVEFWSGGYQFFTGVRGGCNMQRIFSLNPEFFSNHFIYHVANNKQKQLNQQRMLRADNLLGQLNTVRKSAEKALIRETGAIL